MPRRLITRPHAVASAIRTAVYGGAAVALCGEEGMMALDAASTRGTARRWQ